MSNQKRSYLSGVYKIENIHTNEVYIGSTSNMTKRWGIHLNRLRRNEHHSQKLQQAFNEYGVEAFTFSVIEVCSKKESLKREKFYIEQYNSIEDGYNMEQFRDSEEFKKLASTTIAKMNSERLKGKRSINASLDDDTVRKIKQALAEGKTGASVAREFNVSTTIVSRIRRGKTYSNIN